MAELNLKQIIDRLNTEHSRKVESKRKNQETLTGQI